MLQTLNRDWGTVRDVQYEIAWARYVTVGSGNSWFSVGVTDYATKSPSIWDEFYSINVEMVVGFASGSSEKESLAKLLSTSSPSDKHASGGSQAIRSALTEHRVPLMRALDVACLYRNKPQMVMWAHNGAERPRRLEKVVRSWGFALDGKIKGHPIYRRRVQLKGINRDRQSTVS